MIINIIIISLLLFQLCFNFSEFPSLMQHFECNGSFNITNPIFPIMNNTNYEKTVKSNKIFILYALSTWCDYCCQHNQVLTGVYNVLSQHSNKKVKNIKIFSLLSDKDLQVLKQLKIGFFKVPSLYLYHHNKFYQYNSIFQVENIINFIIKIIFPIQNFSSKSVLDIEEFLSNNKYNIKLFCFFANKKEYNDEFKKIIQFSNLIKYRADVSIGITTNKVQITELKDKHNGEWFDYHSYNSLLLKRYDDFYYLDLSLQSVNIFEFVFYNTFSAFDELSNNNNNLIRNLKTPLALFFIDSTYNLNNFHKIYQYGLELSKSYDKKFVFMYMDGNAKSQTKESLGLYPKGEIPTLVVHFLSENKMFNFPNEEKQFTNQNIRIFLDEILNKKENKGKNTKSQESETQKEIRNNIKNMLELTKENFKQKIEQITNKKNDVLLLTINSLDNSIIKQNSLSLSQMYKFIYTKFKKFSIKTIIFSVYDISNNNFEYPKGGFSFTKNEIYIITSDNKIIKYEDKTKSIYRIMKWIEKNASMKFALPELPHLSDDQIDEYYKQKFIVESKEENKNKSEYEIDDMISMKSDL